MEYRKHFKSRTIRQRILILCEGETEHNYFKAIKSDKLKSRSLSALRIIPIPTEINTAKELVSEAIRLIKEAINEKNEFESTWVVFDKDGYTKHPQTFDRVRSNAKYNINIAFSSPSFEFWFLMHFIFSAGSFSDADNLISTLNSHIHHYNKTADIYNQIKHLTITAITNSNKILRHWENDIQRGDHIYNLNPYTDVHILVNKLLNL